MGVCIHVEDKIFRFYGLVLSLSRHIPVLFVQILLYGTKVCLPTVMKNTRKCPLEQIKHFHDSKKQKIQFHSRIKPEKGKVKKGILKKN